MHWMPMLAEAYILNKVREAQEEREQKRQQKTVKDAETEEYIPAELSEN